MPTNPAVLPPTATWGRLARRGRDILAAWQRGETLAAIGGRFGVSRERVRQIVREM